MHTRKKRTPVPRSAATRRQYATTALTTGAAGVIIILTGTAFWLSYAHLAEVALAHGLGASPERAWAWPATIDLFILAGEIMWLRAALANRIDKWAIFLTVVGSVGSIALNVAGVDSTDALDYIVAAVPPSAALLAFGALMRQLHQALQSSSDVPAADADVPVASPDVYPMVDAPAPAAAAAAAPAPVVKPAAVPDEPAPALPASAPAAAVPTQPHPDAPAASYASSLDKPRPVTASVQVTPDAHPDASGASAGPASDASDEELVEAARALAASGPLTLRRMQKELRIGQAKAQRIQRALGAPHLRRVPDAPEANVG